MKIPPYMCSALSRVLVDIVLLKYCNKPSMITLITYQHSLSGLTVHSFFSLNVWTLVVSTTLVGVYRQSTSWESMYYMGSIYYAGDIHLSGVIISILTSTSITHFFFKKKKKKFHIMSCKSSVQDFETSRFNAHIKIKKK